MAEGKVESFNEEGGWGVLTSSEVPGGIWFHHASLEVTGYHAPVIGEAVEFDWESVPAGQDGYFYRSSRVRPLRSS